MCHDDVSYEEMILMVTWPLTGSESEVQPPGAAYLRVGWGQEDSLF